ncbi:hypothetical protein EKPJFOCH_2053 [Methylobacterium thuringiense]|uniref:Uncharacterized protein n=1 Tax=Methylobacterium thuringiense TaxID=1003091 RepID=A0ABQ4TJQ6_9HYPH|nr:hypothetical protein EKPJFOCH_2053 [Methylobacterium thuringiense]
MPLRKSTGRVAIITRTVPDGPIMPSPSAPGSPPRSELRSRPVRRGPRRRRSPIRSQWRPDRAVAHIGTDSQVQRAAQASAPRREEEESNRCGSPLGLKRAPRLPPPAKHLLRRQPLAAGHHRHDRAGQKRLIQDRSLGVGRPGPPTTCAVDELQPPRLKSTLKSRHEPIPTPPAMDISIQTRHANRKGGSRHRLPSTRRRGWSTCSRGYPTIPPGASTICCRETGPSLSPGRSPPDTRRNQDRSLHRRRTMCAHSGRVVRMRIAIVGP